MADTCTYGEVGSAPCGPLNGSRTAKGPKGSEAQQRLQKLESIVAHFLNQPTDLSDQQRPSPVTQDSRAIQLDGELNGEECPVGRLDINGSETSYIGATHWVSILEDVSTRI